MAIVDSKTLDQLETQELAQLLAGRLTIDPKNWHRLKGNRKAQASQQLASALVFLLKDQPDQALIHLTQAQGWLDRSVSAPPCPDHH